MFDIMITVIACFGVIINSFKGLQYVVTPFTVFDILMRF